MNDRHLVWVRHALPSPDPATPATPARAWSLTPGGREDAARLARSLARLAPPTAVVTSNERKAIETAEEVARALGLGPARVSDDVREVQRPWTEGDYRAATRAYLRSGVAPGWEPCGDVLRRLSKALVEHWRPEGTTIVVGHGLAMSVWAADAIDGIDAVGFWDNLPFPDAWLFAEDGETFRRLAG